MSPGRGFGLDSVVHFPDFSTRYGWRVVFIQRTDGRTLLPTIPRGWWACGCW